MHPPSRVAAARAGFVRVAQERLSHELVAVKTFEKVRIRDTGARRRLENEIRVLQRVRHPHVVRLFEVFESPKRVHLCMEHVCGGTLYKHLNSVPHKRCVRLRIERTPLARRPLRSHMRTAPRRVSEPLFPFSEPSPFLFEPGRPPDGCCSAPPQAARGGGAPAAAPTRRCPLLPPPALHLAPRHQAGECPPRRAAQRQAHRLWLRRARAQPAQGRVRLAGVHGAGDPARARVRRQAR
eukprot:1519527-Prymnesium_polylepis.1